MALRSARGRSEDGNGAEASLGSCPSDKMVLQVKPKNQPSMYIFK
jgi:hypothetical protein